MESPESSLNEMENRFLKSQNCWDNVIYKCPPELVWMCLFSNSEVCGALLACCILLFLSQQFPQETSLTFLESWFFRFFSITRTCLCKETSRSTTVHRMQAFAAPPPLTQSPSLFLHTCMLCSSHTKLLKKPEKNINFYFSFFFTSSTLFPQMFLIHPP